MMRGRSSRKVLSRLWCPCSSIAANRGLAQGWVWADLRVATIDGGKRLPMPTGGHRDYARRQQGETRKGNWKPSTGMPGPDKLPGADRAR